jgi:hypothetical protein
MLNDKNLPSFSFKKNNNPVLLIRIGIHRDRLFVFSRPKPCRLLDAKSPKKIIGQSLFRFSPVNKKAQDKAYQPLLRRWHCRHRSDARRTALNQEQLLKYLSIEKIILEDELTTVQTIVQT